jgi:hypothetical protein
MCKEREVKRKKRMCREGREVKRKKRMCREGRAVKRNKRTRRRQIICASAFPSPAVGSLEAVPLQGFTTPT